MLMSRSRTTSFVAARPTLMRSPTSGCWVPDTSSLLRKAISESLRLSQARLWLPQKVRDGGDGGGGALQLRMFTARETTTATVTSEARDWSIMSILAQAVRGMVSVGLKAVA